MPSPERGKAGAASAWDSSRMLLAGGVAGAVARTATAPLDRIKLLFQVQVRCMIKFPAKLLKIIQRSTCCMRPCQAVASSGTSATAYTGVRQAFHKIFREEGLRAFWKGNGVNIVRIFPYSAAQLAANDSYKRLLADDKHELTVSKRLLAGACAGMTATALTHPLDTVRLRLALPKHPYTGASHAIVTIVRTEGIVALYKGLVPTLIGVAPYAAVNFASYDLMKKWLYHGERPQNRMANFLIGALSGTLAATVCYPLDTIRRRMQMKGLVYKSQLDAIQTIYRQEGVAGFYRGWAANTLKVVPQNSIRLVSYEVVKAVLGIQKAKTDT